MISWDYFRINMSSSTFLYVAKALQGVKRPVKKALKTGDMVISKQ